MGSSLRTDMPKKEPGDGLHINGVYSPPAHLHFTCTFLDAHLDCLVFAERTRKCTNASRSSAIGDMEYIVP